MYAGVSVEDFTDFVSSQLNSVKTQLIGFFDSHSDL
jgi:hypothetical protein